MRRLCVLPVMTVAALSGSNAPHAQTPPTHQRVWTGTWEEHDAWQGRNKYGYSQMQISFIYVQGRDEFGLPRWESRRLTWRVHWEQHIFDHLVIENVGAPDERGAIENRYPMDSVTTCSGGGTLELGPAVNGGEDDLTPEQKALLRPTSVTTYSPRDSAVPTPPPTVSQCDGPPAPSIPNDDELTGCAYEKAWPKGGRPAGSFSVSVSAPVTAVMAVDPTGEYGRFVPVPGRTLIFTATAPSGDARFRFELDPEATSHFPGYATNANVDDVFFVMNNLGHLRGHYANDGPDLIFDAEHFGRQEWSRIEPLVVETRIAQSGAVVAVTAMDYGAVGTLRAFVKSDECGDWVPIPIRVGVETRDAVAIPMDEDNNLMADALETYRGRDSGADDDAEPAGNGIGGDGLTAFEEYRGLMTAGASCFEAWTDIHVRTSPLKKDLFVATEYPDFMRIVPLASELFDLDTRLLCGRHIVDGTQLLNVFAQNYNALSVARGELTGNPDARIVNFTLQGGAGLRRWKGQLISQDYPQRAVAMVPFTRATMLGTDNYPLGLAIPVEPDLMGPPGATALVIISLGELTREDEADLGDERDNRMAVRLIQRIVHELGHAVGIPHHSDSVENWRIAFGRKNVTAELSPRQRSGSPPDFSATFEDSDIQTLLVEPGPACRADDANAAVRSDKFVGCLTPRIVRRSQENSGDFMCPMRYAFGEFSYYEPPGVSATYLWTDRVTGVPPDDPVRSSSAGPVWNEMTLKVDTWSGRLLRYQIAREQPDLGKLCSSTAGTEINAGASDANHSGDAGRAKPCTAFVVVNDVAMARGLR